jgi:opacity protein-like surface antigen
MSKRLVLAVMTVAIVVILPTWASAQSPITFAIKAGLTGTTFQVDDSNGLESSSIFGAAAGVALTKSLTDNLSIQGEALVTQKGAEVSVLGFTDKIRISYLNVPVLIRYGSTTTNDTHFHVFTGPEFGLRLSTENAGFIFGLPGEEEVESTDFGWTVGAGVETGPWTVDARYTFGLMNINAAVSDEPVKNRAFMLLAGYRFR